MTSDHSSSHTNHGSHSNSISYSNDLSVQTHSVSIGSSSYRELPQRMEGSLTYLKNAADEVNNSFHTKASPEPISDGKINIDDLQKIINSASGIETQYQHANILVDASSVTKSGSTTQHTNHANSSGNNTKYEPPVNIDQTISNTGASYHANTAAIQDIVFNTTPLKNDAVAINLMNELKEKRDAKAMYEDVNRVLSIINGKKITSTSLASAGSLSLSGTTTYTYSSGHHSYGDCSENLKEDIEKFDESAIEILDKVQVVKFRYKDGTNNDPNIEHYGFIAEDTDEKLSTHYHDRMDYTNCIGILIKAVQELKQEVEELKANK